MHHRRKMLPDVVPLLLLVGVLVTASLSAGLVPARADEPVVRALFFWAETCPFCHMVMDEVFPPLEEEYGAQLEIARLEFSDVPANYELWVEALESFEIPVDRRAVPILLVDETILVGGREIPERFPGLIEQNLPAGRVECLGIPSSQGVLESIAEPTGDRSPVPTSTPAGDGAVYFWLFYSSRCGPCDVLLEEILPPILSKYKEGQVVVQARDLERGSYDLMRALEMEHGLEHGRMPEIFIGEEVLLGNDEIEEHLEGLVDRYLAKGGSPLPEVPAATPTSEPSAPNQEGEAAIHVAYFHQVGCPECDRVQLDPNYLQDKYPQMVVERFDVREEAALAEWLGERADVPERKRLTAPAVFVGEDALVGDDLHARTLEELVARYADEGAQAVWEETDSASQSTAAMSIIEHFGSSGQLTVVIAFAALVLFISYLTRMGREGP